MNFTPSSSPSPRFSIFHFSISFPTLVVLSCYHHRLHSVCSVRQRIVQEIRVSTLWFLSAPPCFSSFSYAPAQVLQGHSPFRCVVTLPWCTSCDLAIPSFPLLFPLWSPPLLSFQCFFSPFLNMFSPRYNHLSWCSQLCSLTGVLEAPGTDCVQYSADPCLFSQRPPLQSTATKNFPFTPNTTFQITGVDYNDYN